MNPRVVAVKLFLEELGLDTAVPNNQPLQCAIYLAQARGVDLGYRFGFYWSDEERRSERTPASPELERDLSELREILAHDQNALSTASLHANVSRALKGVKKLLEERPTKTDLYKWIKLLAMLEYQVSVRKEPEPRLGTTEKALFQKAMATLSFRSRPGRRAPLSSLHAAHVN